MKIIVITNTGRRIATFHDAEETDYIDYSAELDDAIAAAVRAERGEIPPWLRPRSGDC